MGKTKKSILLLPFISLAICGLASVNSIFEKEEILQVSAVQHMDNFELYDWRNYSGNYYNSITANLTDGLDGTLRTTLSDFIEPAGWYTYSSSGADHLSTVLQSADEDPTNPNNMIYLYTRDSVKKNAASSWNREHVWPQADSNGCWGTGKAGTDILHIRPTYYDTNNKRGNFSYGNATSGALTYQGMSYGHLSGDNFCPLDSVKGDVARICMYVWVAYANEYRTSLPPITNVFESYNTLLEWHTLDQPDVMEAHRNDFAETSKQKNRNPFVDHPEYAWKIFGSKCSSTVLNNCKSAYPDSSTPTPPKTLTDLTYTGTPTKKDYVVGESFNPAGLTVTAIYSDASTANVTGQVTWATLEKGNTSVVGTYTDSGKSLTITVPGITVTEVEKTLSSLTYTGTPNKKNYVVGELFNPAGLTVTAKYSDNSTANVTNEISWSALLVGNSTVTGTYTYEGVSKSIIVSGLIVTEPTTQKELISLSKSGEPTKTAYKVGEVFDPTGLEITALFDDGTTDDVTDSVIWSALKKGDTEVTGSYSYNGVRKSITISGITVTEEEPPVPPSPTSKQVGIEVVKNPDKVVYNVGDSFSMDGLKVNALFIDGSSKDVSDEIIAVYPDLTTEGTKIVEVKHGNFKTTFSVVVIKTTVESLQFVRTPAKTEYCVDEPFNPYGAQVKAVLSDGTVLDNVVDQCSFVYDFSKNGIVTVSFGGLSKQFAVTVIEEAPTVEHKAADFAYSFNEKLEEVEPENVSEEQWDSLQYYYNQLDSESKQYVKELNVQTGEGEVSAGVPNAEALKECVTKYDEIYLAHKSEGFEDFIGRNPVAPTPTPEKKKADHTSLYILIGVVGGILLVAIIVILIAVSVSKKSKKKHA